MKLKGNVEMLNVLQPVGDIGGGYLSGGVSAGNIAGNIGSDILGFIGGIFCDALQVISGPEFRQAMINITDNMIDFVDNIDIPDSLPDYLMNSYVPLYQNNSPRLQYSNLAQKNYYRPSNGYHYAAPKTLQARVDYINKPRTSNSYVNFDNKRSEPEVITMKPKRDSNYEQRAIELERRRTEQFYNPVNEQSQIKYTAKKYPLLDNSMQTRGNSAYLNTYQEKPMPLMGDRDYVPPKFNLEETKFEKMKQAILQEAFKNAIKTQRQADNIYGSDEEYYSKYYSLGDKSIEKAEANTNKAYGLYANKGYKNINNVLYPQDVAEIMELQKAAEEELKQIEIERWSEHVKNFTGAALEIGSAFIPAATGAKIVGTMTKALAPRFGTQLAYNLSKNAVIGAMSGSIMGLGDSLINNENPIETMLRYAVISSALGAGLGAVGYKTTPIVTSLINKSKDTKVVVDFLKNGKLNDNLENITVTIGEISKYMPELKPFLKELGETKIKFSKDLGFNGGLYNSETDIITYNVEHIEDSLYHEMQHVLDIKYIKAHPENEDLQIILKSLGKATFSMQEYENKYLDVFKRLYSFNKQKLNTQAEYDKIFNKEEQEIIKIWYNNYKKPYYEHILEVRAREAGKAGKLNGQGIK